MKGLNASEGAARREKDGRFSENNGIGKATRFRRGNAAALKYRAEYADEMLEYFASAEVVFPTFEEFASRLGVISDTLRNWRDAHPRFRDAYARCAELQKHRLIVGGLTESFNPHIVKFLAINNHGMKEKTEQDVHADGDFKVTVSFFEE